VCSHIPATRVALVVIGSAPDAVVAKIAAAAQGSPPLRADRAVAELPLLNELFAELTVERLRIVPMFREDERVELQERTPNDRLIRTTPIL